MSGFARLRILLFFGLVFLAVLAALPCSLWAKPTAGGEFYMPEYNANCVMLDGATERNYQGFTPVKELSFAFFSEKGEYLDMCLTTLSQQGGTWLSSLAFLVRDLSGMPLEELTEPVGSSMAPLEECWPKHFQFDDFNNDQHTDILMLIGCYNGEADRPENDNVVYISTEREGQIWLQQTESLNKAISSYTDPQEAAAAVRKALGTPPKPVSTGEQTTAKALPTPPDQPGVKKQTPPPPPPPAPDVETCKYNTEWGELTLELNYGTGQVTGSYPYQNGQITGVLKDNVSSGRWTQSDGAGNFAFRHSKWGFEGVWNADGDTSWRGQWNGQILQCW